MGFNYYESMFLIPENHSLTFDELPRRLVGRFRKIPEVSVKLLDRTTIAISRGSWTLRVSWEDEDHVVEESREMAALFAADNPAYEAIAACSRRITTAGGADPDMTCFNIYVFVMEVLESIPGLFFLDEDDRFRTII